MNQRTLSNRRFRRLADLLADVGEPCWACRDTAAALHEFDGYELEAPFTLAVGGRAAPRRPPHHIERAPTPKPGDAVLVHGVPATSVVRTLLDLAADEPPDRLSVAVGSALVHGTSTSDELHGRVVGARYAEPWPAQALLRALVRAEGADTFVERRFLTGVAAAGLPPPAIDRSIAKAGRMVRITCRFHPGPVVVELLGYTLRRSPRPPGTLPAGGPIRLHYLDLVERPAQCVATVAAALGGVNRQALRLGVEG